MSEETTAEDMLLIKFLLTHLAFFLLLVSLSVPGFLDEKNKLHCRNKLHCWNARTAAYTIAISSVVKSCARCFDCTSRGTTEFTTSTLGEQTHNRCTKDADVIEAT